MELDDDEVEAAYYGVADCVRARLAAGRKVPPELGQLYRRLDSVVRLSRSRHESSQAGEGERQSEVWIGTMAVADMLSMTPRQVQRHAADIGVRRHPGRLFFRLSAVIAYAERQAAHGGTRPDG